MSEVQLPCPSLTNLETLACLSNMKSNEPNHRVRWGLCDEMHGLLFPTKPEMLTNFFNSHQTMSTPELHPPREGMPAKPRETAAQPKSVEAGGPLRPPDSVA